jgi:hypothetical protein
VFIRLTHLLVFKGCEHPLAALSSLLIQLRQSPRVALRGVLWPENGRSGLNPYHKDLFSEIAL